MKKVLICLLILISMKGYSQQSSISISATDLGLLALEDKGAEKIFHFDFFVSDLTNASEVHIRIGTNENTADIFDQFFTITNNNGEYVLPDGSVIIDNTIKIKVSLNQDQFNRFNYCSVFIKDNVGLNSNTLTVAK